MAIPEKPLEVNTEVKHLTLGEMCIFSPKGFDIYELRAFLIRRTNWSQDEIDAITLEELEDVARQLGEKLNQSAVPLAN